MHYTLVSSAAVGLGLILGALGLAHCSTIPGVCDAPGSCQGDLDGGGPDGVAPPEGCDEAADAKDAPKCVVDSFGVFVDGAGGLDTNAGGKVAPVRTIESALQKLENKRRIYLCGVGPYATSISLTTGVSIYGGFDCGGWTHAGGSKTKIAPAQKGYALHIANADKGKKLEASIIIADLDLAAKDATDPGESSIAVFVSNIARVTFRRVKITAGKGVDGADGAPGGVDFLASDRAPGGNPGATGGEAKANPKCIESIGGAGGVGSVSGAAGTPSMSQAFPAGRTGAGGPNGNDCGGGGDGSYGAGGIAGAGAVTLGELTAAEWKTATATAGGFGGHGQGGGGGAGRGGKGGSGGPGGCGGKGGGAGQSGGSSIALIAFTSAVSFQSTTIIAADAGKAGAGGIGQKAQWGPETQVGGDNNGCPGGLGGHGGSGGGGGGGAGGVSVGLLHKGPAPTLDSSSNVTVGAKGAAGAKGSGGPVAYNGSPAPSKAGADGTPGIDGVAAETLEIP